MADLPLFYRSVDPISSELHLGHRLARSAQPYGFAAGSHLIPALSDEFAAAARDMAIVFAPAGKRYAPVFLCGIKSGRNLFVDADGRWNGAYVPAYLRRYPFILGEREGSDPVVCIDGTHEGFGEGGEGQRLFGDDGKPSEMLADMIRLMTDFATAAKRTDALVDLLDEMGLFKSITIEVRLPGGGDTASLLGLSIVDEEKFGALSDADLLKLKHGGHLTAIFAHLFSIGATNALAAKVPVEARSGEGGAS